MRALEFWRAVTVDKSDFLRSLVGLLERLGARYCVIGGQAVNAYVEPLVSLDLDVVVVADDLPRLEQELPSAGFRTERFPHSVNISLPGSDLRAQIQTDPRYVAFVSNAERREILGLVLPVAGVGDVLQGKVWAAMDAERRPSKRQKDLADISRLLERYPKLRTRVPKELLDRLL